MKFLFFILLNAFLITIVFKNSNVQCISHSKKEEKTAKNIKLNSENLNSDFELKIEEVQNKILNSKNANLNIESKNNLKKSSNLNNNPSAFSPNQNSVQKNPANSTITDNTSSSKPSPSIIIEKIHTEILVKKDSTEGHVTETVNYILKDGIFGSITRKISLSGSSDKLVGFKLAST